MNLGLEALNGNIRNNQFNMSDTLVCFYEGVSQLDAGLHEIDRLKDMYNTLTGIVSAIRKHGVTQSIETLYGENFHSAASMEAEAEAAKKSIWVRIWEAIKRWCARVVAWFKMIFSRTDTVLQKLKDVAAGADSLTYPVKGFATRRITVTLDEIKKRIENTISGQVTIDGANNNTVSISELEKEYASLSPAKLHDDYSITFDNANDLRKECSLLISLINKYKNHKAEVPAGEADANKIKQWYLKVKDYLHTKHVLRIYLMQAQLLVSAANKAKGSGSNNQNATATTPEPAKNTLFRF